jgi:hypothetical protein
MIPSDLLDHHCSSAGAYDSESWRSIVYGSIAKQRVPGAIEIESITGPISSIIGPIPIKDFIFIETAAHENQQQGETDRSAQ